MKVVQLNAVCNGSTGKIVVEISKLLTKNNIENYILYTSGNADYEFAVKYADQREIRRSAVGARLLGNYGFNSHKLTQRLLKKIDEIQPDIIHLHNIHGHNTDLEMLFRYIKQRNIKVFWTFHDCWAFTGYCPHFDYIKCDKWKTVCNNCPLYKNHSLIFDRSKELFNRKKELFSSVKDLTIITPSKWLAGLVKQSFLKNHEVKVINNGIDLNVFKPTKTDFREKYGLDEKRILLGVAMGFGERKGFNYFLELAKRIDKDTVIVLVGVSREQIDRLPENVVGIERTENQKELVGIYSEAEAFINCTLEDNFPTVNIEALACGTPVITFNTGGSFECIEPGIGEIVEQGDVDAMINVIASISKNQEVIDRCRKTAMEKYDAKKCFEKYIELYLGDVKSEKYEY